MSSNISPEWEIAKFSLPSNSFYGNGSATSSTFNSFAMPATSTKTTRVSQSSSRTIIEETFVKQFGPVSRERRDSADSVKEKNMELPRKRSNRSSSPDWVTCRFSLPPENEEETKTENRRRSVSPDWTTSRFSLPPSAAESPPNSPKQKKTPVINGSPRNRRSRSVSPDWNTSRFSLPKLKTPVKSMHKKIVSPRISAPLAHGYKTKINKNAVYTISQKTLDKLLPSAEIHLFDVVKYGPLPQRKDDFLFGLDLMRSEVLNKIDLLHYKKKLRNTGINFIRTFQEPRKPKSNAKKNYPNNGKQLEEQTGPLVSIDLSDQPDEIIIEDTEKPDAPEIEDTGKMLEETIEDFGDKFGGEVVEETTEKSNVVESNVLDNVNSDESPNKATVKITETNTFYHSVTKKRNNKIDMDSLESNLKLFAQIGKDRRHSLPNLKNIKSNGVPKKKPSPNKKKNIIRVKWPIARKSLIDLRNNST